MLAQYQLLPRHFVFIFLKKNYTFLFFKNFINSLKHIPPNHLKVVPRYYHVISVATEVKLHCFRGRGTTAAMAVDLLFCSFPSPRKCRGSKFFFVIFLAAKALIIQRL